MMQPRLAQTSWAMTSSLISYPIAAIYILEMVYGPEEAFNLFGVEGHGNNMVETGCFKKFTNQASTDTFTAGMRFILAAVGIVGHDHDSMMGFERFDIVLVALEDFLLDTLTQAVFANRGNDLTGVLLLDVNPADLS